MSFVFLAIANDTGGYLSHFSMYYGEIILISLSDIEFNQCPDEVNLAGPNYECLPDNTDVYCDQDFEVSGSGLYDLIAKNEMYITFEIKWFSITDAVQFHNALHLEA